MTHEFIAEKIKTAQEAHNRRLDDFRAADRMLDNLGLLSFLDYALDFDIHPDTKLDRETDTWIPVDLYHITIRLDASDKEHIHHLLRGCLDTVGGWKSDYFIHNSYVPDNPDQLVERWIARWDKDRIPAACNRIAILYSSPAVDGTALSPTCSIQEVTNTREASVETRLAVVCSKGS